jgi:hypothetical protein
MSSPAIMPPPMSSPAILPPPASMSQPPPLVGGSAPTGPSGYPAFPEDAPPIISAAAPAQPAVAKSLKREGPVSPFAPTVQVAAYEEEALSQVSPAESKNAMQAHAGKAKMPEAPAANGWILAVLVVLIVAAIVVVLLLI